MIPVTKCYLPPIEEYNSQLKKIWESQWLTNRGALVVELEKKIKNYLNSTNVLITNNGTIPLQIALKVLGKNKQIVTTAFSYVATTASIVWENCTPVFVDIDPDYLTIDENKIESAITSDTTAILATHVFGNPCNIEAIEKIAKKYNLKVIYDAAHCFGVKYKNTSIFNYGDISTCSFHATKLFHTGEGGAIFCKDSSLLDKLFQSHNFGHKGQEEFHGLGINGKISELQAAMGLAVLPHIDKIIADRKRIVSYYDKNILASVQKLRIRAGTEWNYSYYPVIFESEEMLKKTLEKLNLHNIFPRRYFYPSLNTLPYVEQINMPISDSISKKILCLPLYMDLDEDSMNTITNTINSLC